MKWPWVFGMVVLSGVPAIVGGGIIYGLTQSYTAVVIWEAILFCLLVAALIRGVKDAPDSHEAATH